LQPFRHITHIAATGSMRIITRDPVSPGGLGFHHHPGD